MIRKLKLKLFILEAFSIAIMTAPLITLFVINKEHYLKNVTPFGLSLSGILLIVFAIIMVKGKFNLSTNRVFKFFIFFVFCYIFEPFLEDLKIISFMAFIGVSLNYIFFESRIKTLETVLEKSLEKEYEQKNNI